MRSLAASIIDRISDLPDDRHFGRVTAILGMLVEVGGVERRLTIGSRLDLVPGFGRRVPCEVVGFREGRSLLLPFGRLEGIGLGCVAEIAASQPTISPDANWLGRVVNALGEPIDGKGPLPMGGTPIPLRNSPPPAHKRKRMGGKLDLGVRPLNTFTTVCMGQRLGIFAGSGVGKSVMLSMMARFTSADVSVIGLIGERGREVQEFLEDDLGPEGLARSVVVVATSDESPLMRRQAAYLAMSVAESFRDDGRDVLLLMDSVTRFAMAQREIGLSAGEPPTSKGYPPTTFVELPRLLERAGPGVQGAGSITGLFAVLVEGDDHNEPIADATRGILDGHLVLERQIAERGRYPSINVLKSVSRALPMCNSDAENALLKLAKQVISTYEDMAELIRLGAYRTGSDPKVDEAIRLYPAIEEMLSQNRNEGASLADGYAMLAAALGVNWPPEAA